MEESTAYIMVGAPGSGKSTYAKKLAKIENAVIISGDDIRAELFGSAEIQGDWNAIWSRIDELVAENCHRNVILDGTHFKKKYREEIITLLRSYGYGCIEAVVLHPSLATCLARNFTRVDRNVPDYVVKAMHKTLQQGLKQIDAESFDRLNYVF